MAQLEKWYEQMRTRCPVCKKFGMLVHESQEIGWCENLQNFHHLTIKRCKNCGVLSQHVAPTAVFIHGVLVLCEPPTKNHKKNLADIGMRYRVIPHGMSPLPL